MSTKNSDRIRQLNDAFRSTFRGGKVVFTSGVASLPSKKLFDVTVFVKNYSNFTEENDPNGEHDFGSFQIDDQKFFWKIDYYDKDMEYGSEDPSDPAKTTRILTVMLAQEY